MIELIMVIQLCKKNAQWADNRGKSKVGTTIYTILFWFVFEAVGLLIGMALFDGGFGVYIAALVLAVIGGGISTAIASGGEMANVEQALNEQVQDEQAQDIRENEKTGGDE